MPVQKISKVKIDKAISTLKQLPPKEKDVFELREAIYEMRKDLEDLLKKGYSLDELSKLLSEHEIKIKPVTLRQYLSSFKRKPSKKSESQNVSSTAKGSKSSQVGGSSAAVGGTKPKVKAVKDKGFVEMPDDL